MKSPAKTTSDPTIYEIPLSEAVTLTKAWVDRGNFVKAFLINATELSDMLAEKGTSFIRVYFGWDVTQQPGLNERMILVPVNAEGMDMIAPAALADPEVADSNVFDFTAPCPPTCDPESPLFNGQGVC